MGCGHNTTQAGYTLVEIIVVIVVVGILAAIGGNLISMPIAGYVDMARRTRLVDQTELALRRMQRDVRQALPNSIRIGGSGQYLELLHTVDGGRYRRYQDPGAGGDDILDFSAADNSFDILGNLRATPTTGQDIVVYNVTSSGASGNAYWGAPDNTATIAAGSTVSLMNITQTNPFSSRSPFQRFFIVDEPITYACEGGVLNRYSGYAKTVSQATPPSGTPALVTRSISNCNFNYDPGVGQRAGLITLELSLTEQGETITLLHQLHIVNAP